MCAFDQWSDFRETFRHSDIPLGPPWGDLFGPLRKGTVDDLMVVGQLGQSLDGRIATESGDSKYINGPAGLIHLHRLRALMDAVVIGVGTAVADDPQLTVRHVTGPQPARVVIDPKARLGVEAKLYAADGARRISIVAKGTRYSSPPGAEIIELPAIDGEIPPAAILDSLARCGFRRVLIEGGAVTVSRFLAAGCLDRLHVLVAPVIFGGGRAGVILPPIDRADQALRVPMQAHQIEDEVVFDCDLSAHRVPVGPANKSI